MPTTAKKCCCNNPCSGHVMTAGTGPEAFSWPLSDFAGTPTRMTLAWNYSQYYTDLSEALSNVANFRIEVHSATADGTLLFDSTCTPSDTHELGTIYGSNTLPVGLGAAAFDVTTDDFPLWVIIRSDCVDSDCQPYAELAGWTYSLQCGDWDTRCSPYLHLARKATVSGTVCQGEFWIEMSGDLQWDGNGNKTLFAAYVSGESPSMLPCVTTVATKATTIDVRWGTVLSASGTIPNQGIRPNVNGVDVAWDDATTWCYRQANHADDPVKQITLTAGDVLTFKYTDDALGSPVLLSSGSFVNSATDYLGVTMSTNDCLHTDLAFGCECNNGGVTPAERTWYPLQLCTGSPTPPLWPLYLVDRGQANGYVVKYRYGANTYCLYLDRDATPTTTPPTNWIDHPNDGLASCAECLGTVVCPDSYTMTLDATGLVCLFDDGNYLFDAGAPDGNGRATYSLTTRFDADDSGSITYDVPSGEWKVHMENSRTGATVDIDVTDSAGCPSDNPADWTVTGFSGGNCDTVTVTDVVTA